MESNVEPIGIKIEECISNQVLERTLDKSANCRKAFVEREVQPTLDELSVEFKTPRSTVGYWSASQNWSSLRSEHLRTRREAEIVVAQAEQRSSSAVIQSIESAIITLMQGVIRTMQDVNHETAASSRASVFNTCSFAIKNASDACKNVGLGSITKGLKDVAETSGGWSPGLTQQINVILSQQSAEKSIPVPANPPQADETPLG